MMSYLYSVLYIVMFCLGWNIILDEGMILHFLRKPFENLYDEIHNKEAILIGFKNFGDKDQVNKSKHFLRILKLKYYLAKPVVLCITCMASVYGIPIYIYLNGLNIELVPAVVSASFIQSFIWALYSKL